MPFDDPDDDDYGEFYGYRAAYREGEFLDSDGQAWTHHENYFFVPLKANRLMDAQHWQRCAFTGIPLNEYLLDPSLVVSTPATRRRRCAHPRSLSATRTSTGH